VLRRFLRKVGGGRRIGGEQEGNDWE
jgi:hypothetical protein